MIENLDKKRVLETGKVNSIIPLLGEPVPTLRREVQGWVNKKDIYFSCFQKFKNKLRH